MKSFLKKVGMILVFCVNIFAQAANVSGSVAGTVSNVLYSGSSTVPSAAGTYAITANFIPSNTADYNSLTNASAGNFVINSSSSNNRHHHHGNN